MFCYRPVKKTLEEFLKRPGFGEKCEEFKKEPRDPELLGDIYDGRIWKNFKNAEGEPFFDCPNTFGCMLNLDWFQPFKDSIYSVGVLYLSFLNLPLKKGTKRKTLLLLALFQVLRSPAGMLIHFWTLLLMNYWTSGMVFGPKFCRLALVCATCDIPCIS